MSFRKSLRNSMRLLNKKMYRKGKEKKKKCVCVCVYEVRVSEGIFFLTVIILVSSSSVYVQMGLDQWVNPLKKL